MTFLEYIEKAIKENLEFDAIIGDVDVPATYCFNDDWKITDYCKQKYGELLNSEIKLHEGNSVLGYTDVVEVFYDDEEMGRQFTMAVAGYVSESEWNRLFIEGEAIENE